MCLYRLEFLKIRAARPRAQPFIDESHAGRPCKNDRSGMAGVLYFHGFCSSSKSAKGVFLEGRFARCGIRVALPDLDG